VAPQQTPMTQQPMVIPQPMTMGQPGMGQPGMPSQMPMPQPQIQPSQPGIMPGPGFVTGPGVSAGPLTLPSSTVAAQSPLDIFVTPSSIDAQGQQPGAVQQEVRQQQRTIWSGQYLNFCNNKNCICRC